MTDYKKLAWIGQEMSVDLGQREPVRVKIAEIQDNNVVFINSNSGLSNQLPIETFEDLTGINLSQRKRSNIDVQYINLLRDIFETGNIKSDRTGTGTISVFGREIRHNMQEGFPLLTTKHVSLKSVAQELLWFLRGETNIQSLVQDKNYIWVGDAYKYYRKYDLRELDHKMNGNYYSSSKWCHVKSAPTIDGGTPYLKHFTKKEFIHKIKTDDEFAKKFGDMGPIYGKQWRHWNFLQWTKTDISDLENEKQSMLKWEIKGIDQITNSINLLKNNPDSRRIMISAWNPSELDEMKLPPCHFGFQFYVRNLTAIERYDYYLKGQHGKAVKYIALIKYPTEEENQHIHEWFNKFEPWVPKKALSLRWLQRSVDTPLGLPYNIASYGLLLSIVAKKVNMLPDELSASLGDAHIYLDQIDGVKEQLLREPKVLPTLKISDKEVDDISEYTPDDFTLENYDPHPRIKFPLSN